MRFGHERLDVYRLSVQYVGWSYQLSRRLEGMDRHARDQLLRASQSIPLNIAEGNGRGKNADRRRFFEIARGSALECAAIQDVLVECEVLDSSISGEGKAMLHRIVSMLTKLGPRDYVVAEDAADYNGIDNDNDNDNDYEDDYDNDNDYEDDYDNDNDFGYDNDDGNDNDCEDDNDWDEDHDKVVDNDDDRR